MDKLIRMAGRASPLQWILCWLENSSSEGRTKFTRLEDDDLDPLELAGLAKKIAMYVQVRTLGTHNVDTYLSS